jgi:hypothetical protein
MANTADKKSALRLLGFEEERPSFLKKRSKKLLLAVADS